MKSVLLNINKGKTSIHNESLSYIFIVISIFTLISQVKVNAQDLSYEKHFLFEEYDSIVYKASNNIKNNVAESLDYFWLSIAFEKKEKLSDAINVLEEAEKKFNNTLINKSLANLYFETGKYPLARVKYLHLYQTDTLSDWIYKLADIYKFENKIDSAIFYLKEYYLSDSLNYGTLIKLAENYSRINMPGPSIYFLLKAEQLIPGNYYAKRLLANAYLMAEKYDSVINVANSILREDTTNLNFTKIKAYAYFQKDDKENAAKYYSRAVAMGDSSLSTYKRLGLSLIETEVYDSAVLVLKNAIKQDTTDYEIYISLGAAMAQTHQKVNALPYLDKGLELMQPDSSVVVFILENKANIYRENISYQTGLELFLEINKIKPGVPRYLYSIGDLYMALGDYENAIKFFEEVIKILKKRGLPGSFRNELIYNLSKRNIRFIREEKFFEGVNE